MSTKNYDVVVIGGGIVGAGITRDLSLRGLNVALIDKDDFSSGATGRSHALLHSGARYVVKDPDSARECAIENKIIKNIAGHIVEDTKGLFVGFKVDPDDYVDKFEKGCKNTGVKCDELSPSEVRRLEPELNKDIKYVYLVEDGHVDPFRLTFLNILDAIENGAEIYNYTQYIDVVQFNNQVVGVRVFDKLKKETSVLKSDAVVFATGAWTGEILINLGVNITVSPNRGTLIVYSGRLFERVINRLRPPSDGDIVVPSYGTSIFGTTSVDTDNPENYDADQEEIDILRREAKVISKKMSDSRIIKIYSGTRPLISRGGREATRGFTIINLEEEIELEGAFAIVGGKLTTYRLMAEKISNEVAKYLGVKKGCKTHKQPLPGHEGEDIKRILNRYRWSTYAITKAYEKWGSVARRFYIDPVDTDIACACEHVTVGEIKFSIKKLKANNLSDIMRRTRAGMGPCQGLNCVLKVAGILSEIKEEYRRTFTRDLRELLKRKWRTSIQTLNKQQIEQISLQRKSMYQILGVTDE